MRPLDAQEGALSSGVV